MTERCQDEAMPKRSSKPKKPPTKDPNALAAFIVAQATSEDPLEAAEPTTEEAAHAAAVALGRLGGLKGGKARAAALSKKKRSDIAKKAAKARWTGR
ncbi:MAG TPA: hypothetical protein VGM06_08935 [Polyangiaceae bacterium]|jgi:hypothetical protein